MFDLGEGTGMATVQDREAEECSTRRHQIQRVAMFITFFHHTDPQNIISSCKGLSNKQRNEALEVIFNLYYQCM